MSEVHRIKCGNGNCYIIENGKRGILVDTGKREFANQVIEACKSYNVRLLILTHGHFDHAENAAQISEKLGIPIGMNENDLDLIKSNNNQELYAETFLGKIVLSASLKDFKARAMREFTEPQHLLICYTNYYKIFVKAMNFSEKLEKYGLFLETHCIFYPKYTKFSLKCAKFTT